MGGAVRASVPAARPGIGGHLELQRTEMSRML